MMHTHRGNELLEQAMVLIDEVGVAEAKPKLEGRAMVIVVAPK